MVREQDKVIVITGASSEAARSSGDARRRGARVVAGSAPRRPLAELATSSAAGARGDAMSPARR